MNLLKSFLPAAAITVLFLLNSIAGAAEPMKWNPDSVNKVFYMPQFSEFKSISENEMRYFRKTIERAERARVRALILELDTPGGSVDTAFKYLSAMEKSQVPIVVYLKPNGISAGMIIALGADRVVISPNGLIGDAMPIQMGINGVKPVTDPAKRPVENTKNKPAAAQEKKENSSPKPSVVPPNSDPQLLEQILREIRQFKENPDNPAEKEDKELVDQKFLTVFFKMLQVLAEKNQRPVNVVRAMADPYVELDLKKDGIEHKKRAPLTLSAKEALKLGVVDHIAGNRSELMSVLGLGDAEIVEIKRTPTEQIGAFLAAPAIAGLLLILGLVGIFIEIKTPGFGVPGILGISALTLFFLGHMASGASDWGPMVIFFVGLLLLGLEIFVIPGFGLVGILGILCIVVSFFGAFGLENISTALRVITVSLIVSIIIMVVLAMYVLPHTQLFKQVALETQMSSENGCQAQTADHNLIGSIGITATPLRPSGVIMIGQKRYDGTSEGDFLDAGTEVEVTACNGFQLVVRSKKS